jgi:hypothetical protein
VAKQTASNRLDALAAAGLTPKQQTVPKTPTPAQERASDVSEPQSTIAESVDVKQGGRPLKSDEEKATEKVTAYFTPEQYDHIEELQRAYRKRTKKRISVNELLRRLVTTATMEDIL